MLLFALGLLGFTTTSVALKQKGRNSFIVIEGDDGKDQTIRLND
jgi:hypothetical protein